MFHPAWNSWYSVVEDIISTFPLTTPAPWQQKRMKMIPEIMLIGANGYNGNIVYRRGIEPCFTLTTGLNAAQYRCYLLDSANSHGYERKPTIRDITAPSFTINTKTENARTYDGEWRQMTTQALGRIQTVPDSYVGLTREINGNGVPCLFAQRIMESL